MAISLKRSFITALPVLFCTISFSQELQDPTQVKVDQLIAKKAEYHRLTEGEQVGYRIKIHFGIDRDQARVIRTKFSSAFVDYPIYEEYQQPNWVLLVGDYKTKREAFEFLQKIKSEFPNAFIVKGKIKVI
jgi:hypothetical protein